MSVTAVPIRPLARGAVLKLWIALLVLVLLAAGLAWFGTSAMQRETTASGLQFQVIEEGEGELITPADLIALHYELSVNGEVVQSTEQSGQPFVTGTEGLFPGFSEGLQMMRQGGTYRLWVPPALGMPGPLPPTAPFDEDDTLVFRVQVLEVARGMAAMQSLMGGAGVPPPAGAEGAEGVPVPPPSGAQGAEDGGQGQGQGQGRGRGRGGEDR